MSSIFGILILVLAAALAGAVLTRLSTYKTSTPDTDNTDTESTESVDKLIESVNQKLPQTQCAQCGYPGCRPYATAIVKDDVAINQCPPGGEQLIQELAEYLGKEVIALDPERGENKPPQIARIVESDCIGCTLCILACPVDAIVGASRLMHTVIEEHCTGCELCIPPCPVDCIDLVPVAKPLRQWNWPKPS
ncbi:MAG: electron transport complex subunit RsxB [Granulosicoccus sp.]